MKEERERKERSCCFLRLFCRPANEKKKRRFNKRIHEGTKMSGPKKGELTPLKLLRTDNDNGQLCPR